MEILYTSGGLGKDTMEAEIWTAEGQHVATIHETDGRWLVTFYGGTLDAREFAARLPEAIDRLTGPPPSN